MSLLSPITALRRKTYGAFLRHRVWFWRQLQDCGWLKGYLVFFSFFLPWGMLTWLILTVPFIWLSVYQESVYPSFSASIMLCFGWTIGLVFAPRILFLSMNDFLEGMASIVAAFWNRPTSAATHLAKAEARLSEWKTAA